MRRLQASIIGIDAQSREEIYRPSAQPSFIIHAFWRLQVKQRLNIKDKDQLSANPTPMQHVFPV